jgi:hypothetical protein
MSACIEAPDRLLFVIHVYMSACIEAPDRLLEYGTHETPCRQIEGEYDLPLPVSRGAPLW